MCGSHGTLWQSLSVKILAQPHQNHRDSSQGMTLGAGAHFDIAKLFGKDALETDKL